MSAPRGESATSRLGVHLAASAIATALSLAAGCGGEGDPVSPLSRGAATTTSTATTTSGGQGGGGEGGGQVDAGAPRRTVETRNPFGSTKGNLLVDGDFELSVQSYVGSQLGWRAFNTQGTGELGFAAETGGICRTGLRCAVLTSKVLFLAVGAAAPDKTPHLARIWSKPATGTACADVMNAFLIARDFNVLKKLTPQTDLPGEDGWCEYAVALPGRDAGVGMYLESQLDGDATALLDSATLEPDTSNMANAYEAWVPPAELLERLGALRDYVRRTTRFGAPPQRTGIGPVGP